MKRLNSSRNRSELMGNITTQKRGLRQLSDVSYYGSMKARKKVLLVITKSNWGGAQRYVHDLAIGLDKNTFDVAVALGGEGPLKQKLVAAGIPVTSIPGLQRDVNILLEPLVFFSLVKIFMKEHPDVVHLNSSKIGGIGAVAARVARVPRIIFTAHGFAFNENRPTIIKMIAKSLYWFMIFASTRTILVSHGMKKDVESWPFIQKKLTVIHNAIGTLTFMSREEARSTLASFSPALHAWLEKNPYGRLIGTIGELHHVKGHNYSIQAMAKLPGDVAFAIISGGDERENLEKLIRELKVEDRVFLLGARDAAYQYLKAFDIFILPSLSETFGYVLLEASLAEVPVIASNVGGIPDVVDHEKNGLLISSRDPAALESAIRRYLDDPTFASHLALALKKKTEKDFTFDTLLAAIEKVYTM